MVLYSLSSLIVRQKLWLGKGLRVVRPPVWPLSKFNILYGRSCKWLAKHDIMLAFTLYSSLSVSWSNLGYRLLYHNTLAFIHYEREYGSMSRRALLLPFISWMGQPGGSWWLTRGAQPPTVETHTWSSRCWKPNKLVFFDPSALWPNGQQVLKTRKNSWTESF